MKRICMLVLILFCAQLVWSQTSDPQRPMYHFLPPKNWMNDPNGLMYFKGYYHMFYQFCPDTPLPSEAKYWGHAVSKDLVHWLYLPIALPPSKPYDINGVWSGSATIVNGVPTLTYTGINTQSQQVQCTATPANISDPYLVNWTKSANNPIIPGPPSIVKSPVGFRDPTTAWQENGNWYMLVGSGDNGEGALALLFRSPDFQNWTFVQPFQNSTEWFGGNMFECPDFYQIGPETYVLKTSTYTYRIFDMWQTGTYNSTTHEFKPYYNNQGWYDFGDYYASKTFYDPTQDARVLFGWMYEDDSSNSTLVRGWAGVMSLPRIVTLNSDYSLSLAPSPALSVLRGKSYKFNNIQLKDQEIPLNINQNGDQIEIIVQIEAVQGTPFRYGINIRESPQKKEYTSIYVVPPIPYVQDQDLPGFDFIGINISTPDPGICSELCNANHQCFAFAYAPPGKGAPAECFLKRNLPNPNPKTGTVSGVKGLVVVDRTYSTLATDANLDPQMAPLASPPQMLHIFIDHSVVEVFVDGGITNIVSRIYPTLPASEGISIFAEGGSVTMSVDVYEMNSIWD